MKRIGDMWWGVFFFLTLFLTMSIALSVGSTSISVQEVWGTLFGLVKTDPATSAIIWKIRFPRVCVAALVGGSLALAGAIYQSLLRNPLADPYILGISSGSAVGAVIAITSGWGVLLLQGWQIPIFSFLGAVLALACVLLLTRSRLQVQSLLLSGVVVNAFFAAILTFLLSMSQTELARIQFWLMGSFTLRDWDHVLFLLPVSFVGGFLLWLGSRELNIFLLGTLPATHLGVSVYRTRIILLVIASLITSIAVSVSGMIGFVGLVIPHFVRILIKTSDHRYLIPYSFLVGAIFLVGSDALTRVLFEPREIPVGVITACFGAPVFAILLHKTTQKMTGESS
ncbi:FecCD family ABC transporter permease [Shimazuella alba]|uniref:Iron chelate uptake ABC transporter family permease subunit n=1 Tax=Shimazuella alba TaxID=2690964 RepID=A0A6I4VTV5_9BACL|nr:iron ABC transporter permease [Shimazuella alba]MXQ53941.1 iron chelate uptake ABC transporter family permease subunit [Shimazuella alba]